MKGETERFRPGSFRLLWARSCCVTHVYTVHRRCHAYKHMICSCNKTMYSCHPSPCVGMHSCGCGCSCQDAIGRQLSPQNPTYKCRMLCCPLSWVSCSRSLSVCTYGQSSHHGEQGGGWGYGEREKKERERERGRVRERRDVFDQEKCE